ncbi:hypothetical protein FTUN_2428 [Frigoriglobus tundricola]|uniref:Uncharacterized protein n=1 Tax=Frigoriglobus tundricola TaxID=2774151 RepID=A0A6M5YPK5_9BACT|nr:hypothetical protein FTUN_2428 [Frigoriglobus tundricola]
MRTSVTSTGVFKSARDETELHIASDHYRRFDAGRNCFAMWISSQLSRSSRLTRGPSVLGYFRNQVERMDYPTYQANGWYLGPGAVESACKTVVGERLKGSGTRGSEDGAHAVCHVRALYRSENKQWPDFWSRSLAA